MKIIKSMALMAAVAGTLCASAYANVIDKGMFPASNLADSSPQTEAAYVADNYNGGNPLSFVTKAQGNPSSFDHPVAFLDNVGTPMPDGGMTVALLGFSAVGLELLRRRFNRRPGRFKSQTRLDKTRGYQNDRLAFLFCSTGERRMAKKTADDADDANDQTDR